MDTEHDIPNTTELPTLDDIDDIYDSIKEQIMLLHKMVSKVLLCDEDPNDIRGEIYNISYNIRDDIDEIIFRTK